MSKKEVIEIAEIFYQHSFEANCAFSIYMQYNSNLEKYKDAINNSPAFYHIIRNSLVTEIFMKLIKIYDSHKDSVNIKFLLESYKAYTLDVTDTSNSIVKKQEYLKKYDTALKNIQPQLDNLKKQRNKVHAHNDRKSIGNIEEIIEDNPLNLKDIKMLIDLSLDISLLIIGDLTGINKPRLYANINDWENTLKLVEIGEKYRDVGINNVIKEVNSVIKNY